LRYIFSVSQRKRKGLRKEREETVDFQSFVSTFKNLNKPPFRHIAPDSQPAPFLKTLVKSFDFPIRANFAAVVFFVKLCP
jgi:hypothetical protein